jgi:hypothetical protein
MRAACERPASFQEVGLSFAKIEGLLDMSDASIQSVDLSSAKIEGTLDLTRAIVTGPLELNSLKVNGSLSMTQTQLSERATLAFAAIRENLDLSGAEFAELDLSETRVDGALRLCTLGGKRPGRLVLHNTHVGALQDAWNNDWPKGTDPWPDEIEFGGLTYDRLGGSGVVQGGDMLNRRPLKWYFEWLRRDTHYSPQPYEYLADNSARPACQPRPTQFFMRAARERASTPRGGSPLAFLRSNGLRATDLGFGIFDRSAGLSCSRWSASLSFT